MSKLPTKRYFRPRTKSNLSDKLPKLRIIQHWRQYPVGAVIQPPGVLRQVLINRGIGEIIEEEEETPKAKIETAPELTQQVKKRRGRPPKIEPTEDE